MVVVVARVGDERLVQHAAAARDRRQARPVRPGRLRRRPQRRLAALAARQLGRGRPRNLDPVNAVSLRDWYLRDAGLRSYLFPPQAVIPPSGSLRVNVGTFGDDATIFPWGLRTAVFGNVSHETGTGDGAYLFDPLGNVRASMVYPCRWQCSDPLTGAVALSVDPIGRRESVTLTNVTAAPIDLDAHVLYSSPQSYHFGPGSVLPPGASMRIQVVGDSANDTALDKRWGMAKPILRDAGDVVRLSSYTDITVACTAWGDKSC